MEHTSQSGEEKRPYHSHVRQRQAEETRRRILVAARSLFESQGYAVTTLEAIAEIAEVSPKTIAAVFGAAPGPAVACVSRGMTSQARWIERKDAHHGSHLSIQPATKY